MFTAARSAGRYGGVLPAVIHQLKFNGRDQLAKPLSRLLWFTLVLHWSPSDFDHVVPVPLHHRRMRQRGFNQAQLLVRQWSSQAAMEGIDLPLDWIDGSVLSRRRHTRPQTGLKRDQRMVNLHGAFTADTRKVIRNKRFLLVDDVFTTGTTAEACSTALMRAGAASVHVLTLGRTEHQ